MQERNNRHNTLYLSWAGRMHRQSRDFRAPPVGLVKWADWKIGESWVMFRWIAKFREMLSPSWNLRAAKAWRLAHALTCSVRDRTVRKTTRWLPLRSSSRPPREEIGVDSEVEASKALPPRQIPILEFMHSSSPIQGTLM